MKKTIIFLLLAILLLTACVSCVPNGEDEGQVTTAAITTEAPETTTGATIGNGSTAAPSESGETSDPPTPTEESTDGTTSPIVELPILPF